MEPKSFIVEYHDGGRKMASRIINGLKSARREAQRIKRRYGETVWVLGFDRMSHLRLEERV